MLAAMSGPSRVVRQLGFTLPELLLVFAMLGILLGSGMPVFTGLLERQRLSAAADHLGTTLLLARSAAIYHSQQVQLVFTLDEQQGNWCYGLSDSGTGCDCRVADPTASDFCAVAGRAQRVTSLQLGDVGLGSELPFGDGVLIAEPVRGLLLHADHSPLSGSSDSHSAMVTLGDYAVRVVAGSFGYLRQCSVSTNTALPGVALCG